MPRKVVERPEQVDELAEAVRQSAIASASRVAELIRDNPGLTLLHALRFEKHGRQPLSTEPLNLVEQLNQTFTCLATLAAARYLLRNYPASAPFTLNLGPTPGPDIASNDGQIVAEVFAAVDPDNNDKLARDIEKVRRSGAPQRFVFYYCPGHEQDVKVSGAADAVTIVSLANLDA